MYMLWSEETFFSPVYTQAIPFAYEMHSGDKKAKKEAMHSASQNPKMQESFRRSTAHPGSSNLKKKTSRIQHRAGITTMIRIYIRFGEHRVSSGSNGLVF